MMKLRSLFIFMLMLTASSSYCDDNFRTNDHPAFLTVLEETPLVEEWCALEAKSILGLVEAIETTTNNEFSSNSAVDLYVESSTYTNYVFAMKKELIEKYISPSDFETQDEYQVVCGRLFARAKAELLYNDMTTFAVTVLEPMINDGTPFINDAEKLNELANLYQITNFASYTQETNRSRSESFAEAVGLAVAVKNEGVCLSEIMDIWVSLHKTVAIPEDADSFYDIYFDDIIVPLCSSIQELDIFNEDYTGDNISDVLPFFK